MANITDDEPDWFAPFLSLVGGAAACLMGVTLSPATRSQLFLARDEATVFQVSFPLAAFVRAYVRTPERFEVYARAHAVVEVLEHDAAGVLMVHSGADTPSVALPRMAIEFSDSDEGEGEGEGEREHDEAAKTEEKVARAPRPEPAPGLNCIQCDKRAARAGAVTCARCTKVCVSCSEAPRYGRRMMCYDCVFAEADERALNMCPACRWPMSEHSKAGLCVNCYRRQQRAHADVKQPPKKRARAHVESEDEDEDEDA